jgi:hypothetical protein
MTDIPEDPKAIADSLTPNQAKCMRVTLPRAGSKTTDIEAMLGIPPDEFPRLQDMGLIRIVGVGATLTPLGLLVHNVLVGGLPPT